MLLSDVCLSVTYSGPNSRTERPKETKIGTEVAHVTRDSDTTFKVKRSTVNLLLIFKYPTCRNRCHVANKYEDIVMLEQHRHLANKCKDIVNLQGADAYCVATCTACYSKFTI